MNGTRQELPWDKITAEIISAIDSCNNQRVFVNTTVVSDYIAENRSTYPSTVSRDNGHTKRLLKSRVCMALKKLDWPIRAKHDSGIIFYDPRYSGFAANPTTINTSKTNISMEEAQCPLQ